MTELAAGWQGRNALRGLSTLDVSNSRMLDDYKYRYRRSRLSRRTEKAVEKSPRSNLIWVYQHTIEKKKELLQPKRRRILAEHRT